jgi:hypothetical protein
MSNKKQALKELPAESITVHSVGRRLRTARISATEIKKASIFFYCIFFVLPAFGIIPDRTYRFYP